MEIKVNITPEDLGASIIKLTGDLTKLKTTKQHNSMNTVSPAEGSLSHGRQQLHGVNYINTKGVLIMHLFPQGVYGFFS